MRGAAAIAMLALLASCGGAGGVGTSPAPVGALRPEDRVLLGDFSRVNAVAAAFDRVYVAYPTALAIWRPLQRRWDVPRAPYTPRDLEAVRAAVVDPLDQSVWLVSEQGWLHYRPESDRWDRGFVGDRITAVGIDPSDPARGIWLRTTRGWVTQPSIGPPAPASPTRTLQLAPTIEDAMADLPQLRALAPTMLVGPRMEQGQFTSAARSARGDGWYLGTSNQGLLFVDRVSPRAESIGLGMPGEAVGAMVAVPGGVWVATDADYRRSSAVTFVDREVGMSRTIRGGAAQGLPFDAVRRILPGDRVLWLGTDRGLVRIGLDDERVTRIDEGRGLPDDRVVALASWRQRVLVGTMRGLAMIDGDSIVRVAADLAEPVTSLLALGDTAWVGTTRGLLAVTGARDPSHPMPEVGRATDGSVTVLGLATRGDTLLAMTVDRLLWRDPRTGAWAATIPLSGSIGRLGVLDAGPHGIWVGGDRGAALVDLAIGAVRAVTVPADVPDIVTAIANDGRYLWVGTRQGVVRMLLR